MMKTLHGWILGAVAALFIPWPAYPAQITNESFSGGTGGWVGSGGFGGTWAWTFTGGVARVQFINPGIQFPDYAELVNTGAFAGDYDLAGINLVGFSFIAHNLIPGGTNVILEWGGSTSVYQMGFTVSSTGLWYHFSASLSDAAQGRWTLRQGSMTDFPAARQSVSHVTIRVNRNGIPEHSFSIDDIFLANQPAVGLLGPTSGTSTYFRADSLLVNHAYEVESSPAVTGTWTVIQSFIATNAMQWVAITNSGPQQFWRMVNP